MRKALLALPLLALAACGERTVVIQQPVATTRPPVVTPTLGVDTYINDILNEDATILNDMGKKWVIDFAYATCGAIDEGMTINDLLDMAIKSGADGTDVGRLTRLAIVNLCPENQWFIDAATNA